MLILRRRPEPSAHKGEGEGGYLASASDLMIGLLFVFIILVVVLALEQRRKDGEVEKIMGAADPRASVTKAIGEALKGSGLKVAVDETSGVISLPSDALFAVGEFSLGAEAQAAMVGARARLADVLNCYVHSQRKAAQSDCPANPGGHEIDTIFLEGHTDSRPMLRQDIDNVTLSFKRARAIHQLLLGEGSPLLPLRNQAGQTVFSYSAYGDTRLLPGIAGEDAQNRRVDMRIVLKYQSINDTLRNVEQAVNRRP